GRGEGEDKADGHGQHHPGEGGDEEHDDLAGLRSEYVHYGVHSEKCLGFGLSRLYGPWLQNLTARFRFSAARAAACRGPGGPAPARFALASGVRGAGEWGSGAFARKIAEEEPWSRRPALPYWRGSGRSRRTRPPGFSSRSATAVRSTPGAASGTSRRLTPRT